MQVKDDSNKTAIDYINRSELYRQAVLHNLKNQKEWASNPFRNSFLIYNQDDLRADPNALNWYKPTYA